MTDSTQLGNKRFANLIIRPELRADWYDGNAARLPYQDGRNSSQLMLGCDAILKF